jgi:hypothetical protein
MGNQGVLTVVTEIQRERVAHLVALLDELDATLDGSKPGDPIVDFRVLDSVHFARFSVLPPAVDGAQYLVFSTAYDGPRTLHLTELVKRCAPGLSAIYEHCVDYPAGARVAPATLSAYLERHGVPHGALHVGYVGRTVRDIRDEEALRRFIEDKLDERRRSGIALPRSARETRELVVGWVREGHFAWALEPRRGRIAPTSVDGFWKNAVTVSGIALGLVGGGVALGVAFGVPGVLGYAGLLVALGIGGYELLRHYEETEPAKTDTDVAHGLEHAEDEDYGPRNQLTHLVDVKPSRFRHLLLRAVLLAIEFRARFEFWKGDLGGIETIHCAHWAILDGPKTRLLFVSNYDGSWEKYLGDFIEEAGGGMTSVWSNTVDFPRAKDLLEEGATNERVFKAWTREKQVRTQVWYAADPAISIRNVNDNSRIRDGLRGFMTEEEAREWLRLL